MDITTNAADNIIIGNSFGLDASGKPTLPNKSGIGINTGHVHNTIGGFTAAEQNVISGGDIGLRLSGAGIKNMIILGNEFSNFSVMGILLESVAKNNFIRAMIFRAESGACDESGLRHWQPFP